MKLTFSKGRLLKQYPGQISPQPIVADVYSDSRGEVYVHYNPEIGNAVPADVYHRETLRFTFSGYPTKAQARKWYNEMKKDIHMILIGSSVELNGQGNRVRTFSAFAEYLLHSIEYRTYNYDFTN